jgi:hypothetical protein
MNGFFYLTDSRYFSSSLIGDSLVVGENTGDLQVVPQLSTIRSDHNRKDVKFYPMDDLCFTTTDRNRGIRVWDRAREEVVFKYKEEPIRMHTYDREGCMAAVADGCIKFYDLRVRYHVGAAALRMCRMAEWSRSGSIYVLSDEQIVELDTRKIGAIVGRRRELKVGERVLSLASLGDGLFCTVKRGDGHALLKLCDEASVERPCSGHEIIKVRDGGDDFVFCIATRNIVTFYEYRDTWSSVFHDCASIQSVCFGEHNSYLFADGKLFCMEGGYRKFRGR